jgi:hypothetical protein
MICNCVIAYCWTERIEGYYKTSDEVEPRLDLFHRQVVLNLIRSWEPCLSTGHQVRGSLNGRWKSLLALAGRFRPSINTESPKPALSPCPAVLVVAGTHSVSVEGL